MTEIEAKKIIGEKLACMTKCGVFEREQHINSMDCDECSYCYEQGDFGQQKEALQVAIQALEKKIPKKPTLEADGYSDGQLIYDTWICPYCEKRYETEYDNYDYCPNCGQAIDWSNEE